MGDIRNYFARLTDDQIFELALMVWGPVCLIAAGWVMWLVWRAPKGGAGNERH